MSFFIKSQLVHKTAGAVFCALFIVTALVFAAASPAAGQCFTTEAVDLDPGETLGVHPVITGLNTVTKKVYYAAENGVILVYDATTDALITTLAIGTGQYYDMVIDENANKIYLTDDGTNSLLVIDGATDTLEAAISVGTMPRLIAVHPTSGRLYVTHFLADVFVVNSTTNTVEAQVAVANQSVGIGINGNDIYVSSGSAGTASVIDGDPVSGTFNTVIATISTTFPPDGDWNLFRVAVNEGTDTVYLLNPGSHGTDVQSSVAVVDGSTRAMKDLGGPANPVAVPGVYGASGIKLRPSGNAVIVWDSEDINGGPLHTFSVMSGVTNDFSATGPNQDIGGPITSAARSETLQRGYYVADGAVHVVDIDGASPTFFDVLASMPFGTTTDHPKAMAIDEAAGLLYVAGGETNTSVTFDLSDNSFRETVFSGGGPFELSVDSSRNTVWVGHRGGGAMGNLGVRKIDGVTKAVTDIDSGVFSGWAAVINRATNWIYTFSDIGSGNVKMIPIIGATNTVSPPIALGGDVSGGTFTVSMGRFYLSDGPANALKVVDVDPASPTFNTLLTSIPICVDPEGVVTNEEDGYIYVGCNGGHVAALNAATNTVVATIPVNDWSDQLALNSITKRLYVSSDDLASPAVKVIDVDPASTNFNKVISSIIIATMSEFIAVNEATDRVYVNIDNNATIGVIDGAKGILEDVISIPNTFDMPLAVDEKAGKVYALDRAGSQVHVIDGNPASPTFNTLLESVPTGFAPNWMDLNTATHQLFTTDYGDNTVTVVTPDLGGASFDLTTGIVTLPEVTVGGKTYWVQLMRRPGEFVFDLHDFKKVARACTTAFFFLPTGVIDIPVIKVGKKTYSVQLTRRPGSGFVFDLTSANKY